MLTLSCTLRHSVSYVGMVALAVWPLVGLTAAQTQTAQTGGLAVRFSQDKITVTVSGTVRAKPSGSAIPNALVRAHIAVWRHQGPEMFDQCPYQEAVADGEGKYQILFVTPLTTSGPFREKDGLCVYASAPGYETKPQYARPEVTARNSTFTNLNFELSAGKRLRGVVVDAAGQPVPEAYVRMQNGLNEDWNFFGAMGRTFTGPDGTFELWTGSADAEYLGQNPWLCIVKPGVGTLVAWNIMAKEDLGSLTLNSGGDLVGKVLDAAGKPLAKCEVSVRRWPFDLVSTALTDQEGKYHLRAVPGEPGIKEFYKNKNGRYDATWGKVDVFARPEPALNLKHAPHCQVLPKDGRVITCPDLACGGGPEVSGVLMTSKTALGLGGLLVRLDTEWEDMVEADVNGRFRFPFVAPGKHTLTAYLPHNLRYDRGIGKTPIEVAPGKSVDNIQIQLMDLAELRVQYLDAQGSPLPGITASAAWSKSGDGGWTEGTVSDHEGWAILYLYPESPQYVRGVNRTQELVAETAKEVNPEPGQVMSPLQVVMVQAASVAGRLVDGQGQRLAQKVVLGTLTYADGTVLNRPFKTDAEGGFRLERITPGILKLAVEIENVVFADPLGKSIEVRPGEAQELGNLVLKDGLDKDKETQAKRAQAVQHPEEVSRAAEELFNRIRGANYDQFLKPDADWHRFPIVGYYQTHQWFDVLVVWLSTTFKTNPIVSVELGQVYANPGEINGQKGLPTVPYKVTLKNGAVLQGDLPFEYNHDGGKGHWHGIEGIDWHLQNKASGASGSAQR